MVYATVRAFDNYLYANILLSRLKEEGIDCYLKDENTVTIDPLLSPAIGGIKLMVPEGDLLRVNALIDSFDSEYAATVACPNCGQQAIQVLRKTTRHENFFTALFYQLINGSTQSEEKTYKCANCGHKLRDLPAFTGS